MLQMEKDINIRLFRKEDGEHVLRMTLDLIYVHTLTSACYRYFWKRKLWIAILLGALHVYIHAMHFPWHINFLVPIGFFGFCWLFLKLLIRQGTRNNVDFHGQDAFVDHWSRTDIGNYLWVMEKGDKVIGSVAIERHACNTAYLSRMVIVPEFRGQGYSKKLMRHAIAQCRARRYIAIELGTTVLQTEAWNLYESCGFVRYHTFKMNFIKTFGITDIFLYRLRLGRAP